MRTCAAGVYVPDVGQGHLFTNGPGTPSIPAIAPCLPQFSSPVLAFPSRHVLKCELLAPALCVFSLYFAVLTYLCGFTN